MPRELPIPSGIFNLKSNYQPCGDQPQAIKQITDNLNDGVEKQTLLGVTGSGKTFTLATIIANVNRPALVIAPNKTLAAQLYSEFKEFFPNNHVSYFVSYYDYFQPEAYIPTTDTYIEKDSSINEEIDKMRHAATRSILEFRDTIIVASVSCIYGLGAPEDYFNLMLYLEQSEVISREDVIRKLVEIQYERSDMEFARGDFRVRGDVIDVFPSDSDQLAIRLVFFGDEIEEILVFDPITGVVQQKLERICLYPLSHYVTEPDKLKRAIVTIRKELKEWLPRFRNSGKMLEAQRLEQRVNYDLELMQEIGFCSGIENYSRHVGGREEGQAPTTLLDYFPDDFLLIIDESHVTIPQIGGMARGDRARKSTLVDYGFRLPSAIDNRPLTNEEFWKKAKQTIFVSATPGDYEINQSEKVIEMINRPTGIIDPEIIVRPATNQIDNLLEEVGKVIKNGGRVLVLTLTKKMAEDLSSYFREININSRYLHSEIKTIERIEILNSLRKGEFDVLIGINLLREGLDLVEVKLVAILDADKEGFLRSYRSLIQIMGRAARNSEGKVVLYADRMTDSINNAIQECERRRKIQIEYNTAHGITPKSAERGVRPVPSNSNELPKIEINGIEMKIPEDPKSQGILIEKLKKDMYAAASKKEFETAAKIRDQIAFIQKQLIYS